MLDRCVYSPKGSINTDKAKVLKKICLNYRLQCLPEYTLRGVAGLFVDKLVCQLAPYMLPAQASISAADRHVMSVKFQLLRAGREATEFGETYVKQIEYLIFEQIRRFEIEDRALGRPPGTG